MSKKKKKGMLKLQNKNTPNDIIMYFMSTVYIS